MYGKRGKLVCHLRIGGDLKKDKVVKIARLSSCKNFVSKREKFIFDAFVDL